MYTGLGFAGREAIFREGGLIKHVLITEANIEDSLFIFTLFPLRSPGFSSRIKDVFKVSADQAFLAIDRNYISASILNWCLVVSPDSIDFLTEIGRTTKTARSVQDAYIAIRRRGFGLATSSIN